MFMTEDQAIVRNLQHRFFGQLKTDMQIILINSAAHTAQRQQRQKRRDAGLEFGAQQSARDRVGGNRKPHGDRRDQGQQKLRAFCEPGTRYLSPDLARLRNAIGKTAAAALEARTVAI